jgi:hypothetical protein
MRYKRIPTCYASTSRIINALYADYKRRENAIKKGAEGSERFAALNEVLSSSVSSICEPDIREGMLFDLCNDLGYDKSTLATIMCHKTYYERKKAVKEEAARRLGLI